MSSRLRIGVNALYLIPGSVGGTEIYLRNLLRALAAIDRENTWYIFTNRETESELVPTASNFIQVQQPVNARNRPFRLLWEQTMLPLRVRHLGIDCLFNPGFTAPLIHSCPNVTVFHDLQHKRHPQHFRWFDRPAWDFFLALAVRGSELFVVDSQPTRSDLMHYYRVPAEKIRVALLGVEDEFFSIADLRGRTEPFLLCASTLHPHKNIERLVRVFARWREERPEFSLVLAGMKGFQASAVEGLISQLNLRDAIRVMGWIPRTDLYDLFRRAAAFIYPSTFEGFGLPVVEAMAAGVPLACSDIEPLRSITSGAAALFHPEDDEAMLAALRKIVVQDPALIAAGRRRAREFTWKRCAESTLAAISEAVLRAEFSAQFFGRDISR